MATVISPARNTPSLATKSIPVMFIVQASCVSGFKIQHDGTPHRRYSGHFLTVSDKRSGGARIPAHNKGGSSIASSFSARPWLNDTNIGNPNVGRTQPNILLRHYSVPRKTKSEQQKMSEPRWHRIAVNAPIREKSPASQAKSNQLPIFRLLQRGALPPNRSPRPHSLQGPKSNKPGRPN
jgi:hypothetical protein